MKKYICLLRGINVSGKNLIKMEALKACFEKAGLINPQTYLQSGNIIFGSNDSDQQAISEKIGTALKNDFGADIALLVLTADKIKKAVSNNPFLNDPDKNAEFFHLTFLSKDCSEADTKGIFSKKDENEEILILEDIVYLYCPNGYGRTKLNNNFLESKLKTQATTRNWKTVLALEKMID